MSKYSNILQAGRQKCSKGEASEFFDWGGSRGFEKEL